jgi:transposase
MANGQSILVAGKVLAMLSPAPDYAPPSEQDLEIFEALVPPDHYLRRAASAIDFERFRTLVAPYYSPDQGRPAKEPVLLLKLEFLQYHDRLSDSRVIGQAQVNIAYREFLGLGLKGDLPDPSLLSRFRARLGAEGHQRILDDLVAQAREHGLVKDRLRLKDATHVFADVAIPPVIGLVAGIRQRLLEAVGAYDGEWAEGQRIRAEMLRNDDAGASDEQRLAVRVTHLREIIAWVDELVKQERDTAALEEPRWMRLKQTLGIAHKVLADRDAPKGGDRLVSLEDTDARFGYHHGSFCGYLLDITMDAESELVTSINVLPANGDEAADAATLVRQEEEAHGNDVESLSADSVLFQGEKLRELSDPEDLDLEVFVPPVRPPKTDYFRPEDFKLDETGQKSSCPAGKTTSCRYRNSRDSGWTYRFRRSDCAVCPLREKCMKELPKQQGRAVNKGEYIAEYAAAREKAETPEYAEVRKIHPKVERKLGEIVRHHDGRRARCRGRPKVLLQELLATLVVNARRIVQMLCAQSRSQRA